MSLKLEEKLITASPIEPAPKISISYGYLTLATTTAGAQSGFRNYSQITVFYNTLITAGEWSWIFWKQYTLMVHWGCINQLFGDQFEMSLRKISNS